MKKFKKQTAIMKSNRNPSRFTTHLWFRKLVGLWIFRILEIWTEKSIGFYSFARGMPILWMLVLLRRHERWNFYYKIEDGNEMGLSWFRICQWGKVLIKETRGRDWDLIWINRQKRRFGFDCWYGQWWRKTKARSKQAQGREKREEEEDVLCSLLLFFFFSIYFWWETGLYKKQPNTVYLRIVFFFFLVLFTIYFYVKRIIWYVTVI